MYEEWIRHALKLATKQQHLASQPDQTDQPNPPERPVQADQPNQPCQAVPPSDIPIAALVIDGSGAIIGVGVNTREAQGDPTGHAEINALRAAGLSRGDWHLEDCTLVATLEPCTMCAGAAVLARVRRIVFAAWDPKAGACGSIRDVVRDRRLNHQIEVVGGVLETEARTQLRDYFNSLR
ncbi:MAG: nucleoside deaminase [Varibaculum sp.]|nr:nucleoside deaminase [Varibaculum sp.]